MYVVSGYATPAMVSYHLNAVKDLGVKIKLIVGMCPTDGMLANRHKGFCQLTQALPNLFECNYVVKEHPSVHSKIYAWFREDKPICGFVGSANYTQNAFLSSQQGEIFATCNPLKLLDYFKIIERKIINCTHSEAEKSIRIHEDMDIQKRDKFQKSRQGKDPYYLSSFPKVKVSFLTE